MRIRGGGAGGVGNQVATRPPILEEGGDLSRSIYSAFQPRLLFTSANSHCWNCPFSSSGGGRRREEEDKQGI